MQNDSTLYRQAAWQAYAMQRHGSVMLLPNTRAWVVSTGLCAWVAMMLLALNTHSFTEKSTVAGFVSSKEPSIAIVAKEGSGLITDVYVKNGQHVKKGERLLSIMRTNHIIVDKNNVSAQLNALNQHIDLLEQVKKTRLQDSLQQLEYLAQQKHATLQQKDALLLQANYLNQRIEIAQEQVSKFAGLARQQLVSADTFDNATQALLSMRQQSAQLSQQLSDNRIKLAQIKAQEASVKQQSAQQPTDIKLSQLPIERQLKDLQNEHSYTLYATRSGVVSNLQAQQGDDIARFPVILKLAAPEQHLGLQLAVPSSSAGFIEATQEIRVRLDAFPYQKYGTINAKVERVARTITLPNEHQNHALPIQQAVFMVHASLEQNYILAKGEQIPLKEGMTVQADVVLSERSLFEWLLSPLYSLKGSI